MNPEEEQGNLTDNSTVTVIGSGSSGTNELTKGAISKTTPTATLPQTPPADWQAINNKIEAAKKEAAKKAQDELVQSLGLDNPDALKEVVKSYQQMVEAQKTDQQKADEARLKMEKQLNEQAAELAKAKHALQVSQVEAKILTLSEQYHIKKGAARMLAQIEAQNYQVGDDGTIKEDELRVIVKKFAEDNKDLIETANNPNSSTQQKSKTITGSANQALHQNNLGRAMKSIFPGTSEFLTYSNDN